MRLKWYGHVGRRDKEKPVRRTWGIEVEGRRPRGRPKLRFKDVVQQDMEARGLRRSDAQVRRLEGQIRNRNPEQGSARRRRRRRKKEDIRYCQELEKAS